MVITPDSRIVRTESHVDTRLDDEVVVMSVGTGLIFSFPQTAGEIWDYLARQRTYGDLIDHLTQEFDVPRATCEADVTRFLRTLIEQDMIQVFDA